MSTHPGPRLWTPPPDTDPEADQLGLARCLVVLGVILAIGAILAWGTIGTLLTAAHSP